MPYSSKAIANAFINRAIRDRKPITALKLQKLIYYAHGHYLGATGKPLINELFEAWQYGPVVPSVYHEFKQFGGSPISSLATEVDWDSEELPVPPPSGDAGADKVIDFVWEKYGPYSGTQLSEMTHKEGTPWQQTAADNPFNLKNLDIENSRIQTYFEKLTKKKASA